MAANSTWFWPLALAMAKWFSHHWKKLKHFKSVLPQYTSGNRAFKGFLQGLLYSWGVRAGGKTGGLESKTFLTIHWRSSSKYQAIEDKAETTGGAIVKVKTHDMAGVLLPLVRVTPVTCLYCQEEDFEEECAKRRIKLLSEIGSSDMSS